MTTPPSVVNVEERIRSVKEVLVVSAGESVAAGGVVVGLGAGTVTTVVDVDNPGVLKQGMYEGAVSRIAVPLY